MKGRKEKKPKERKPRPTPAQDRSIAILRELQAESLEKAWSPARLRTEIRKARAASRAVWNRCIVRVFGATARELPDTRQLLLFGGSR